MKQSKLIYQNVVLLNSQCLNVQTSEVRGERGSEPILSVQTFCAHTTVGSFGKYQIFCRIFFMATLMQLGGGGSLTLAIMSITMINTMSMTMTMIPRSINMNLSLLLQGLLFIL